MKAAVQPRSVAVSRVSELVDCLVTFGAAAITAEFGGDADRAGEIMRAVAHDLCSALGGGSIYIPKDTVFGQHSRNKTIFQAWRDGGDVRALAVQHELTVARVYQIIEICRFAEAKRHATRARTRQQESLDTNPET